MLTTAPTTGPEKGEFLIGSRRSTLEYGSQFHPRYCSPGQQSTAAREYWPCTYGQRGLVGAVCLRDAVLHLSSAREAESCVAGCWRGTRVKRGRSRKAQYCAIKLRALKSRSKNNETLGNSTLKGRDEAYDLQAATPQVGRAMKVVSPGSPARRRGTALCGACKNGHVWPSNASIEEKCSKL